MKCNTLSGSRKIITQIKVFTNQLPVLENLHKRNPTLYPSPNCVLCNNESREDASHMVACDGLKSNWKKAEDLALELTWNMLKETDTKSCDQNDLRDILYPRERAKRYSVRLEFLKGLVCKSTLEELLLVIKSSAVCKSILQFFLQVFWNSFYEEVWKERCDSIIVWEKSVGITRKDKTIGRHKRSQDRSAEPGPSKQRKRKATKTDATNRILQNLTKASIANTCSPLIRSYIQTGRKPYWVSS